MSRLLRNIKCSYHQHSTRYLEFIYLLTNCYVDLCFSKKLKNFYGACRFICTLLTFICIVTISRRSYYCLILEDGWNIKWWNNSVVILYHYRDNIEVTCLELGTFLLQGQAHSHDVIQILIQQNTDRITYASNRQSCCITFFSQRLLDSALKTVEGKFCDG